MTISPGNEDAGKPSRMIPLPLECIALMVGPWLTPKKVSD